MFISPVIRFLTIATSFKMAAKFVCIIVTTIGIFEVHCKLKIHFSASLLNAFLFCITHAIYTMCTQLLICIHRRWFLVSYYGPVVSSFVTFNRVCNQSNTTGATSRAGTAYPSEAHEFTSGFQWPLFCLSFDLRIMISPFDIFTLFFYLSAQDYFEDSHHTLLLLVSS